MKKKYSKSINKIQLLRKKNKSFLLNCGYGKGYSVLEIVNFFKKINNRTIIKFEKRRKGDVAKIYANTKNKAKEVMSNVRKNRKKCVICIHFRLKLCFFFNLSIYLSHLIALGNDRII